MDIFKFLNIILQLMLNCSVLKEKFNFYEYLYLKVLIYNLKYRELIHFE